MAEQSHPTGVGGAGSGPWEVESCGEHGPVTTFLGAQDIRRCTICWKPTAKLAVAPAAVTAPPGWWRICNCAGTPPTMPTCRDTHLETCPLSLRDRLIRVLRENEERETDPPIVRHGRPEPDAVGAVFAGERMTLQAVLALFFGWTPDV